MATDCPAGPEAGLRLVMLGKTVNGMLLLPYPVPPTLTITETLPVVPAAGTGATIVVALQLAGTATAVPNKSELEP